VEPLENKNPDFSDILMSIPPTFFSEISENSAGIEPFADPRLSDFTGFLFHDVDGGVN
jgi:hypothetical protein